jgi:hypothetical protein
MLNMLPPPGGDWAAGGAKEGAGAPNGDGAALCWTGLPKGEATGAEGAPPNWNIPLCAGGL